MKSLKILLAAVTLFSITAQATTRVRGYTRSNGTYVSPHYRSDSNSRTYDNWSTKGNTNPYTGSQGTKIDNSNNYFSN